MIRSWKERADHTASILAASETVTSVFRGFGELTHEGWPAWAAQQLMEDYPVFDSPEEYTYENLCHYAWARLANNQDFPWIGKDLNQTARWQNATDKEQEDALYDLLYRLLIEPLIFLSHNEKEED